MLRGRAARKDLTACAFLRRAAVVVVAVLVTTACASRAHSDAQVPAELLARAERQETVQNGPGNQTDWVGLYQTGAPDTAHLNWFYLNGSQTLPASGVTAGTLTFALPASSGSYEFRFYRSGFLKLATSPTVTVQ
jgi:hypothetical protein